MIFSRTTDRYPKTRRRSVRWLTRLADLTLASILPLTLLIIWDCKVRSGSWPKPLVAPPSAVVRAFTTLLMDGDLFRHAGLSLQRLLGGLLLGSAAGVCLGALVGLSRLAERVLGPTVQLLAPIPVVAWIPLLIIRFGVGEANKVAIVAVGVFFVVFASTVQGIRGTDTKLVEVAAVHNKNPWQLATQVLLPSALPSILTGLRLALGLSWILLIVAEVVGSAAGLGWLIWNSRNFSRPDDMIVGMISVGILGKLSDWLLLAVQAYLLRWRQAFQGQ